MHRDAFNESGPAGRYTDNPLNLEYLKSALSSEAVLSPRLAYPRERIARTAFEKPTLRSPRVREALSLRKHVPAPPFNTC